MIIIVVMILLVGFSVYRNNPEGKAGGQMDSTTGTQVNNPPNVEELPRIGFKAPHFTLKALDGKSYSTQQLDGVPVIINFWASWCGPCKAEAPEFVRLYDKYRNGLEIYAVNLTLQDNIVDVKSFVDSYGFIFPILLDEDRQNQIADRYQVLAIPTTFFIDRNGIVVDKITGITDPKSLEKKFKNLISR